MTEPIPLGENPSLWPVDIIDGKNFLRLNPIGGLIESLKFNGIEVITSPKRGDGKIVSTHFCVPMLGPDTRDLSEGAQRLPQHGPARNDIWQIVNDDSLSGLITVKYELKHTSYPGGLIAVVNHQLKDGQYSNTTVLENKGTEEMPIVPGWHLYWNAFLTRGNYVHQGYDGITLNGDDIFEKINPDSSFIDLAEKNILRVPGMYEVELAQTNLPRAVLWAGKDGQGKKDKNYFCLEPIARDLNNFGKPESMLAPKEQREFTFGLKLNESLIVDK